MVGGEGQLEAVRGFHAVRLRDARVVHEDGDGGQTGRDPRGGGANVGHARHVGELQIDGGVMPRPGPAAQLRQRPLALVRGCGTPA